jgi:methyltransferase (TIGR00027 family)
VDHQQSSEPLVRDISDTARWVAAYRALESERPDAVFRDPFAAALAGDRGQQIAAAQPFGSQSSWAFVARTYLFDAFVRQQVGSGVDLVINLAAGLDTRPYRMDLPKTLRWVEVDLPQILDYKEGVLGSATPVCSVERVRLDLADRAGRNDLFARLGRASSRALVLSEGLLIYLDREQVEALARDLAAVASFRHWAIDICSPGLLKMLQERGGQMIAAAGAPYKFAPAEGPAFFESGGWRPLEVRSVLKAAAKLNRLSLFLRVIAMLPASNGPQGSRPWSAAVLLARM